MFNRWVTCRLEALKFPELLRGEKYIFALYSAIQIACLRWLHLSYSSRRACLVLAAKSLSKVHRGVAKRMDEATSPMSHLKA